MRIKSIIAIAALLVLAVSATAQAQNGTAASTTFTSEIGLRGTSTTGDAARYERYRDLGNGLFADALRFTRHTDPWLFTVSSDHLGRKDQRIIGRATRQGKVNAWFMWDQIPMLLSTTTQTFFQGDVNFNQGTLTIPDNVQQAGQTSSANIPLLFSGSNIQGFDLKTRRHIAEAGVRAIATENLSVRAVFRNTDREGGIPFGGSFGHSQVVETVAPTSHQLRDFEGGAEWAKDRYLFRAGYTGSWFNNDVTTLTFDNPWRLTDGSGASSRGRLSLPPSSSYYAVNGMASVKLPGRSRATVSFTSGVLKDADDALMPNTINTASATPLPLPRETVDGQADTLSYNMSFTSRPVNTVQFSVRLRSYEYDNKTPEFDMIQRIAYDNASSTPPVPLATPIPTEPFGVLRHNFDADLNFLPQRGMTIGVGMTRNKEERNHRIFEHTIDNVYRVVFDVVGNQWFSVRTKYEHAEKRGHGFEEEVLTAVAEQPGMRHFDVASRDRDRVTFVGTVTPVANLMLNLSVAAGNDDYVESLFGLRDNKHRVYGVGFETTPRENVSFGASYSREKYTALSRSRQANPGVQFTDESRNWAVDSNDGAHSFLLSAEFLQLLNNKVDVTLAWDINRAKATYHYMTGPVAGRTLPEETPNLPTTLPTPTQLPDVISNLNRGTLDVVYALTSRLGLGVSYWYEKYEVEDFALDAESTKNLALSNAVLLGYLYRPYTAQTGWVRLIVRW